MIGPKERKERALGVSLQLKGTRSGSPKSAVIRKPYRPGAHGKTGRRKQLSDFGRQIQEKQKFKLTYGIDERGLRRLFAIASRAKGSNAVRLLELLETRLDNAIYRLGFAPSRSGSRQLVTQGHIFVNKKRVRSPGYQLAVNDIITIRPESASKGAFRELPESLKQRDLPSWLALDPAKLEGRIIALPSDEKSPFEISLLVESFSK